MLQKLGIGDDHVVGFRWEGEFDEKAFKQSLLQFLPELQSRSKMNIYFELIDIGDFEATAVWEDIKFGFNNMKELRDKIDKIALVTDKDWVRNIAESSYKLIPGIKLKSFTFKESEAAKLFVQE